MKRILMPIICLAFASGCVVDDPESAPYKGGDCGDEVVSDFRATESTCRLASYNNQITESKNYNCTSSVNAFLSKYPGIRCDMEEYNSETASFERVRITVLDVKELDPEYLSKHGSMEDIEKSIMDEYMRKSAAESFRFKSGKCGIFVTTSYNSVVSSCAGLYPAVDSIMWGLKKERYAECVSKSEEFLQDYPGINCDADGEQLHEEKIEKETQRYKALLLKKENN